MKRLLITAILGLIISIPLTAAPAEMGTSGGYDLDRLLEKADDLFSLSENDAVILLNRKDIEITPEGDLKTRVHSVVRIGTRSSIRSYADLRVPCNSDVSEFRTIKLRTWMDGRWWPDPEEISETAVVRTLPSAIAGASDYAAMREVMLLHDGVELPCIVETEYEIIRRGTAKDMPGGFEIFAQSDPAVMVEYSVKVPGGSGLEFASGNGAAEPEKEKTESGTEYIWKMENIERLGSPRINNPSSHLPYIVWSTAADWKSFGEMITSNFNEAAVLGSELSDTVSGIVEFEPAAEPKVRALAKFINSNTRPVHYHPRFWFPRPRPAARTWETAYGHSLDRAVLAAAMIRGAGLGAELLFISGKTAPLLKPAAQIAAFEEICLQVSKDENILGFYYPESGKFTEGFNNLLGRAVWNPAESSPPAIYYHQGSPESPDHYHLQLTLEHSEGEGWTGTGFMDTDGIFCVYEEIAGREGGTLKFIDRLVSSVLPGAGGFEFNPEVFDRGRVAAGFRFRIEEQKKDDQGRVRLVIGEDPAGGIMARIPSSLHLSHEERTSPVVLPVAMSRNIRLIIKAPGLEPVYLPEDIEINNIAGSFLLKAEESSGSVIINRELSLDSRIVPAESWVLLRALLLEDADLRNRTVILE
jgi:hypothetical protein